MVEQWGPMKTCDHREGPAYTKRGCPHPAPWVQQMTALIQQDKTVDSVPGFNVHYLSRIMQLRIYAHATGKLCLSLPDFCPR